MHNRGTKHKSNILTKLEVSPIITEHVYWPMCCSGRAGILPLNWWVWMFSEWSHINAQSRMSKVRQMIRANLTEWQYHGQKIRRPRLDFAVMWQHYMVLGYKQIRFLKINITILFKKNNGQRRQSWTETMHIPKPTHWLYVLITNSKYTVMLILTSQAQHACIQKRLGFLQKPVHYIYTIMCMYMCVWAQSDKTITRRQTYKTWTTLTMWILCAKIDLVRLHISSLWNIVVKGRFDQNVGFTHTRRHTHW